MKSGDLLLYDLTTIFYWSEQIKRVEYLFTRRLTDV